MAPRRRHWLAAKTVVSSLEKDAIANVLAQLKVDPEHGLTPRRFSVG
jgi:hypothetical protein